MDINGDTLAYIGSSILVLGGGLWKFLSTKRTSKANIEGIKTDSDVKLSHETINFARMLEENNTTLRAEIRMGRDELSKQITAGASELSTMRREYADEIADFRKSTASLIKDLQDRLGSNKTTVAEQIVEIKLLKERIELLQEENNELKLALKNRKFPCEIEEDEKENGSCG